MKSPAHDISVSYLGLELCSPLIPSASPLGERVDNLQEMESCGAGAVVLPSLFEDPVDRSAGHPEYYFEEIIKAKAALKIPVIASLSATSPDAWSTLAAEIERAGANALELNIFHLSLSPHTPSSFVEQAYVDVVKVVTSAVKIPVAVKLPPFFTNLTFLARQLKQAGASGLVLFNRFYQPDLDLLSMGPAHTLRLSTSADNRLPLRWISLLYQQNVGDLAASTGIRSGADVLKMILSGASVTQVCSVLLQRGIPWLRAIGGELYEWMDKCHVQSLKDTRGALSHRCMEYPRQTEREQYRTALQGYARLDIPTWRDEIPLHVEHHLDH